MRRLKLLMLAAALAGIQANAAETGPPRRLVAAGGAVTEIIYALGQGDRLAGSDISSLWPEDVKRLPRIGYLRTLSAEGILALHPDMLLTTPEAGPPATLEHLRAGRVRIETIPGGFTPESVETKLTRVAEALGQPERGRQLVDRFRGEWDQARASVAKLPGKPRVLFVLAHTGQPDGCRPQHGGRRDDTTGPGRECRRRLRRLQATDGGSRRHGQPRRDSHHRRGHPGTGRAASPVEQYRAATDPGRQTPAGRLHE